MVLFMPILAAFKARGPNDDGHKQSAYAQETLLEQLAAADNAEQRSEIERQLDPIDTALEFLDRPERTSEQ